MVGWEPMKAVTIEDFRRWGALGGKRRSETTDAATLSKIGRKGARALKRKRRAEREKDGRA